MGHLKCCSARFLALNLIRECNFDLKNVLKFEGFLIRFHFNFEIYNQISI